MAYHLLTKAELKQLVIAKADNTPTSIKIHGGDEQTPPVGRKREQDLLLQELSRALHGHGGLVTISGEAGIGKTTLVDVVAGAARRSGASLLVGACFDLEATPPYGPWLDAFAGYQPGDDFPNIPAGLRDPGQPGAGTSQSPFAPVRDWLAQLAERQPLVLILEDFHWADEASLGLLRFVARGLAGLPLLIVVTWRDDEPAPHLTRMLPALIREARPLRLGLRPFGLVEMRALVSGRYRLESAEGEALSAWLQQHVEGNPFFAIEALLALEQRGVLWTDDDKWHCNAPGDFSVPRLVRELIEQRLNRLTEITQRVLEYAAVIGEGATLSFVQRVADVSSEDAAAVLDEAIAAYIVAPMPGDEPVLHFRHALVRESLYQRQTFIRRRERHRRVAEFLLINPAPSCVALAHHFQSAHDRLAVTWLAQAGEQSLAVFAPHDAITYLQRADELARQFGEALPRNATRARGRAHEMVGEFDKARADYEQALHLARSEGDRHAEWQALLDLGGLWAERDYDRAGQALRQALVLARQELDEVAVAHSLNAIGNWHLNHDEPLTALNFHQEALAIFARRDDRQGVAATSDLLALSQFVTGDVRGAADRYSRVVELLEEVDERRLLSSALANWAATGGYFETDAVAVADGALDYWLAMSARAQAIAREIGWADGQAYAEILAGAMLGHRGEMGRGMDLAVAGLSLAEQIGHRQWMVCGHVALGRMHADVFDFAAARAHLEAALSLSGAIASPIWTALSVANLIVLLIDLGELETAELVSNRVSVADRPAVSTAQRCCRLSWARLLLARREAEEALRVIDSLIVTAPKGAGLDSLPWIALARGQTLIALDRNVEAEAALGAAQLGARAHGYRHLLWRTDLSLVQLLRQSGRISEASVALAEARGVINEIAATLPSTTQRDTFLAVIRRRCSANAHPAESPRAIAGLTPRELEVLRLVAAGLTDAEAGQRLSIARRTVGRHLESIYNKLGVGSRTAAAAFAFEHGLMTQERD